VFRLVAGAGNMNFKPHKRKSRVQAHVIRPPLAVEVEADVIQKYKKYWKTRRKTGERNETNESTLQFR